MLTDQTVKADLGKTDYTLVPPKIIAAIARSRMHGVAKYGRSSWVDVEPERYIAAMMRHLEAYRNGELIDPDSGEAHLGAVALNAGLLLELGYAPPVGWRG